MEAPVTNIKENARRVNPRAPRVSASVCIYRTDLGSYARVKRTVAADLVASGQARYASRTEWKEAGRP